MSIDKELLSILCCPETKEPVTEADDALIARINEAISHGVVRNRGQRLVSEKLEGGLLRADRRIIYPIIENIPVMLIDEGIPIDQGI